MSDMPLIMYMKYELNYPFFFIVSLLNTTGNNIIFMINHVAILVEVTIQASVITGAGVNHPTQFHPTQFQLGPSPSTRTKLRLGPKMNT